MDNNIIKIAKEIGYQGDSNTEAECWIRAVEKGLDMSEEARYERAREMGFNTEDIYYHGTARQFDRFDKSTIGDNYTYSEHSGFFFTKKKSSAENYASLHSGKDDGGRVLSVFLKFKNPYVTKTNSYYYSPIERFDLSGHDMMHDVRLEGKDAIFIEGTRNDDLCVVLDPSQILSIHAAFDLETESYRPEIDIDETLEDFLLDYNLDKNEGHDVLNDIVNTYCHQEKENQNIGDIKNTLNRIIEEYEFEQYDSIKNTLDNIVDNHYKQEEEKLKNKETQKTKRKGIKLK